ncbi:MAG: hypothetical protein LBL45_01375 [Treponema sp.]|nr:hypothetical protein [Treponema sp.]
MPTKYGGGRRSVPLRSGDMERNGKTAAFAAVHGGEAQASMFVQCPLVIIIKIV